MKNLKWVSDPDLLEKLQTLVRDERRITLEILWHLREVEARRLYAERGFSSLFDYCVNALSYSESAAYRRIAAMRALKETPELEVAIQAGRLSVSTVARVQTFFRAERAHQKDYSVGKKLELFLSLEGKSSKEVERRLMEIAPKSACPRDRERVLTSELTEIRFTADRELIKHLKELQDLFSHQLKDPTSYAELIGLLARKSLAKRDRATKSERRDRATKCDPRLEESVALAEVESPHAHNHSHSDNHSHSYSRYIPQAVRREVWRRSGNQCTYVDPITKRKCDSRFRLQVDHQWPFALGGSSRDLENLTLLCANHNQLRAIQIFGEAKMDRYMRSGRT